MDTSSLRYWRYRIFAVTWLAYAGFYLCLNILGSSLIGIMPFGPDALMTGAAAMDIGSQKGAGVAAYVSESRFGWNGVFSLFVVFSIVGGILMATKWNSE